MDTPVIINPEFLASRRGKTARWWREHLPILCEQGIVTKIGRVYWARLSRLDAFLAGEFVPPELPN